MIGRWIDSLDDAARDRIIEHPDPTYPGMQWWSDERDCGCLVGCATQDEEWWSFIDGRRGYPLRILGSEPSFDPTYLEVGGQFPALTHRFTPERMWRVCKARAARRYAVNVEPATALAEVA